jgi:hypothetical protein
VTREPFRAGLGAMRRYRTLLYGVGPMLIVGLGLTFVADPLASTCVAVALLAFLRGAARWSPQIERAFDDGPQIESQNVVARRAADTVGAPLHLVLLAHLDSKSARWPTFVTAALLIWAALGIVALGAWSFVVVAGWLPPPRAATVLAAALAFALPLFAGLANRAGNESPGAMDNASGLAVLCESARTLAAEPALAGADLTFLATGAEEIGLAGAMRWVQRHESEYPKDATVFINLDSVGVGRRLLAMNVAGSLRDRPTRAFVREAAREAGVELRFAPALLGVGVDTMPIAARGFATVTLLGEVMGAASRRFHSRRDTAEHLSEGALLAAARAVLAIALRAAGPLQPREARPRGVPHLPGESAPAAGSSFPPLNRWCRWASRALTPRGRPEQAAWRRVAPCAVTSASGRQRGRASRAAEHAASDPEG